ncbi:aminoglycoside phosphotransferase family protein [Bacillus shivajii]|uniref:aminoglycoside phosphotransferase family protein n=1 Tax=Bacillus shivajii TaxID=1983719 RepID=UPI001CFA6A64|nr:aminoglycoside phosphotransferase family protein [Bacillus shivajii]UCZ53441.1 aminoglycoside phosphotransferase family protein [Bacillus shivajii]
MDQYFVENIRFLKDASRVVGLMKGFSYDEKYVIDDQHLLRIFSTDDLERRKNEFDTIKKVGDYSTYVPTALEFGVLEERNVAYMILTYLPGTDAEAAMSQLTREEQYEAGFQSGEELQKLHKVQAPAGYPSWWSVKKKKSDRYLNELKNVPMDEKIKRMLQTYIFENEDIMKRRPNTFQHDDFHPSNLIIHNKKFAGIIDFQRMDWGDPIHDLQKLGFFLKTS